MNYSQRIIFMGTPLLAVPYLDSLLKEKFNIIGVYTQPPRARGRGMKIEPSPIQVFAESNKLPLFYPSNLKEKNEFQRFKNLNSDLVVVMGYGIKLPKIFLDFPKYGCINVHLSILPKWRGASPVEHALLNGDKETGVTIFKLNEFLDSGPILASKKLKIDAHITKNLLIEKLNKEGQKLLINILPKYFQKKINLSTQKKLNITYAPKIKKNDSKLNFYDSAIKISNKVRAFSPNPGAWFTFNNERIKIINCSIEYIKGNKSTIMSKDFLIGCSDFSIRPTIIQREGKNKMEIKEFLKGFKFSIGDKLN